MFLLFFIMLSEKDKYIKNELSIVTQKIELSFKKMSAPTCCNLIVIDNFYDNPIEIRKLALTKEFNLPGNGDPNIMYPENSGNGLFPGKRTESHSTQLLKDRIQKYINPFGGKITTFFIPNKSTDGSSYNGCFQLTNSKDQTYVTYNEQHNWAGVLFLTPMAPLDSGIRFYQFFDGSTTIYDSVFNNNVELVNTYKYDTTKWKIVDSIGNLFNRLVLFKASNFHMFFNKFGNSDNECGLFQVFFFSTEK
jgi:hypothetical protein